MIIKIEYDKKNLARLVEFEGTEKEFYKFAKEFSLHETFEETIKRRKSEK